MTAKLTINQVLKMAIRKEIESQQLYIGLSKRVDDQAAKDAFGKLAEQEKGHQNVLERYLRGELKEGALGGRKAIDYKIAEHFDQPEISLNMKLKDAFLLAANCEKASHEFYLSLAKIHPAGEIEKLLNKLAVEELKHKQKVEFLYNEVAFPQTSGG